jgi:soluble lytic murein transglycosylase-like protein
MTIQQNELMVVSSSALPVVAAAGTDAVKQVGDVNRRLAQRMRVTALIALALAALTLALSPSLFTAPGSDMPALSNALPVAAPVQSAGKPLAPADAGTLTGLKPKDEQNLVAYLARKWRVADAAVVQLVQTAVRAGKEHRVDPLLILAVMSVESGLNPYAESHAGAQGLMQIMTSVHKEKFERFGGEHAALHPVANIFVGAQILADLRQRGGSVEQALKLYVGAGNMENDGGYGARVLGERSRIANATQGKYDFTTPGFGVAPVAASQSVVAAMVKTSISDSSVQTAVPAAAPVENAPLKDAAKEAKEAEVKAEKVASAI